MFNVVDRSVFHRRVLVLHICVWIDINSIYYCQRYGLCAMINLVFREPWLESEIFNCTNLNFSFNLRHISSILSLLCSANANCHLIRLLHEHINCLLSLMWNLNFIAISYNWSNCTLSVMCEMSWVFTDCVESISFVFSF